jgi:putative polyhydroxyalkanoate system protein
MSHINIHRTHVLSHEQARDAAEEVASHLRDRFQLDYRWDGNTLFFERSGVNGHMEVGEQDVHIVARLGFLLIPLKGVFEREIHRHMDELFTKG